MTEITVGICVADIDSNDVGWRVVMNVVVASVKVNDAVVLTTFELDELLEIVETEVDVAGRVRGVSTNIHRMVEKKSCIYHQ